jgi:AcrR family transcriptional regulator
MLKKVPKQARSEQMVNFILAGATRVLNTMPLADATTNRIAEVAGVSIGSLYQYFDSKEAIGLCLLQQHLEDTVGLLREARIASKGCGSRRRARMPFAEILRDHRSKRMLHLNLIGLANASRPAIHQEGYIGRMIDEIALGLEEERPDACRDQIRLCATLYHQNATLLVHSAISNPNLDRDSVVMGHFDALKAANLKSLDVSARSGRRRFPA